MPLLVAVPFAVSGEGAGQVGLCRPALNFMQSLPELTLLPGPEPNEKNHIPV